MSDAFDTGEVEALLASDARAAHAYLETAARAGNGAAQVLFGQALLDGIGTDRDPVEALYWFQHAAHQDVPMAMNMLGRCYENGWGAAIDHALAATWFRRAADRGLDWGVYNHAHQLANGRGVPQDRAAAFQWFGRAAAMGHARAMHFLGQYHENGWETARDIVKAFALYRQSAEAGDYRGECSWASVLAQQGEIDEAVVFLERAIPKAPPHFLAALADQLATSPHVSLRELLPKT